MNQQILILVLVLAVIGVMSTVFMMSSEKAVINLPSQTVGEGLKIVTFNPDTGKINTQYSIGSVVQAVDALKATDSSITNAYKAADSSITNAYKAADTATLNAAKLSADTNRNARAAYVDKTFQTKAQGVAYRKNYVEKNKNFKLFMSTGNPHANMNVVGRGPIEGSYFLGSDKRNLNQFLKITQ